MAVVDVVERGFAKARKSRRVEAWSLALLAVLPLVPHLTFLLQAGVGRYEVYGEIARLEQATRHLGHAGTSVGPWSELGWHQPGPLFFLVTAPFEALGRGASTGLYLAAWTLNAAAAATMVIFARLYARRAHAIAVLVGCLAWCTAFGNVAVNPSSSALVVLPLMAFLVTAALFARNRHASTAPLFPAVLFGALVAQTRVATLPTVLAGGLVASIAYVLGTKKKGGLTRSRRARLGGAAGLCLVLFVPPLVEQMTAPAFAAGNLARLWDFFGTHRPAPPSAISIATQHWTTMTSLLPIRIVGRALSEDAATPAFLAVTEMPHGVTTAARSIAFLHVVAATVAAVLSARRGDLMSLALITLGILGDVAAVLTLQASIGTVTHEAAFWLTASSTVAWMGVLSAFSMMLGSAAERVPRFTRFIAPTLIVFGLTGAVTATSLQRTWLAKQTAPPAARPDRAADLRIVESTIKTRIEAAKANGALVVLHRAPSRAVADAVVLELEKDGVAVRVAADDAAVYAGDLGPGPEAGSRRAFEAFFAEQGETPPGLRCVAPAIRVGELAAYVTTSPTPCPD